MLASKPTVAAAAAGGEEDLKPSSVPPSFPPPPPPAKQCLQPRQVSDSAAGGEEDPEDYNYLKATAVAESEGEAKGPDDLVDVLSFDSQSKVVDKATRS